MTLLAALRAFCEKQGVNKTYYVAYSGGLDSQVLLHALHQVRLTLPLSLHAVHIHHGLSPHADKWRAHCAQFCAAHHIAFTAEALTLTASDNLEERARDARYDVLSAKLQAGDVLLTAHHQQDQAETLLLQLCRGAGTKGLAGMPVSKPFGKGAHVRPLLDFSREALLAYAEANDLTWVEDESNLNQRYTRNFMRHAVMPVLSARWPQAAALLSRSAAWCAETQDLLEEFGLALYAKMQGSQPRTLSVSQLKQQSPAKQRLLLRIWLQQLGMPLPDRQKLMAIQTTVLEAAPDRFPRVAWQDVEVRRYRDDLYALKAMPVHDAAQVVAWAVDDVLTLPGVGELRMVAQQGAGLRADIKQITVRFRAGGEQAQVEKRGRLYLKNLWQEWQVPTWERARIPLLYVEGELVAIPHYFLHSAYAAKAHEAGQVISFRCTYKDI